MIPISTEVIDMVCNRIWAKAQDVKLQVNKDILPEFDIGFDKRIPHEVQEELCAFVRWVEDNYVIPITLWVQFEYCHYLISRAGNRVGYLFDWADFSAYPVFDNREDIPQIRLPVRTERSTMKEILRSFIEAITDYYAWICNELREDFVPDEAEVDGILREYLRFRGLPE